MTPRPPLALLLTLADPARLRAALLLALCEHALAGQPRLFVQGSAVAVLAMPVLSPDDDAAQAAGEPSLAALLDEVLAENIPVVACQSGLAIAHIAATVLDSRITIGGLIGFLGGLDPADRLITL